MTTHRLLYCSNFPCIRTPLSMLSFNVENKQLHILYEHMGSLRVFYGCCSSFQFDGFVFVFVFYLFVCLFLFFICLFVCFCFFNCFLFNFVFNFFYIHCSRSESVQSCTLLCLYFLYRIVHCYGSGTIRCHVLLEKCCSSFT